MLKKIKSKKNAAQHLIEYTIVLTLVSASIIIMSPYVIRSWNAAIKGWEDSVKDSFEDRLPTTNIVVPVNPCMCGPWTDWVCGGGFPPCPGTTMYQSRTCDPMGCGLDTERCNPDPRCCIYTPQDCGGTLNPCPPYQRHYLELCGGMSAPVDVCGYFDGVTFTPGMVDPTCSYCTGSFPALPDPRYIGLCFGDDMSVPPATPYVTVPEGGCSGPAGPKCEIECRLPYFPVTATTCGSCPPSSVWVNGCVVGQCDRMGGFCGPRQCYR
ncbi:MAG: hypothetical protein K8S27_11785 [Candidatus Omnitrophica bacterium]|nr:hypothetical protein [Candidatus Omnitrophota bacterium]